MWLGVADLEFRASVRFIKNGEVEEAMMRRVAVDTQQGALDPLAISDSEKIQCSRSRCTRGGGCSYARQIIPCVLTEAERKGMGRGRGGWPLEI